MATKQAKRARKKPAVRYIVDARGQKKEVVLPISMYRRMLERLEDIEDLQYIEQAMKDPQFIPWEEAKRQLDELADSN